MGRGARGLIIMVLGLFVLSLALSPVNATVTKAQAKAFWKEFDDATLRHKGPATAGYPGGPLKIWDDITNFTEWAGNGPIRHDITVAGGGTVSATTRQEAEDAKPANDRIQRLSDLQLKIMEKHFMKTGGGIDFDALQEAMEMFANGELRPDSEMNQLYQWQMWIQFAQTAIKRGISENDWKKVKKSLVKAAEIYNTTYSMGFDKTRHPFFGNLWKDSSNFDPAKQLSDAEKKKLRAEIDGLSFPELENRAKGNLKDLISLRLEDGIYPLEPRGFGLRLATVQAGDRLESTLELDTTDSLGRPVDTDMLVLVSEPGFVLMPSSFTSMLEPTQVGSGMYEASFSTEARVIGLVVLVIDLLTLDSASKTFMLGEGVGVSVIDSFTGRPVTGVDLTITRPDGTAVASLVSDIGGAANVFLLPGEYVIRVHTSLTFLFVDFPLELSSVAITLTEPTEVTIFVSAVIVPVKFANPVLSLVPALLVGFAAAVIANRALRSSRPKSARRISRIVGLGVFVAFYAPVIPSLLDAFSSVFA